MRSHTPDTAPSHVVQSIAAQRIAPYSRSSDDLDALLQRVCAAHTGYVFKTVGDAFCVAFAAPAAAVTAALEAQRALQQTFEVAPTAQSSTVALRVLDSQVAAACLANVLAVKVGRLFQRRPLRRIVAKDHQRRTLAPGQRNQFARALARADRIHIVWT